jgi:protoporphyrinogen oxidase
VDKILVLGAGPSGLSYSLFCPDTVHIIEQNGVPGGHASSYEISGFTFDYGPHILFSRDKEILQFVVGSLGENVELCKRNNKISFKNKLIKYPFENDLFSLPLLDNFECLRDFIFNKYKFKYKYPKNMKEWFLHTFGKSICTKYLFPYNEKVWNIKCSELSMTWSDRIPNPPMLDVIKSSFGINTDGYKHQLYYHYPKEYGYQAISNGWSKYSDISYNETVLEINKNNNYLQVITSKKTYDVNELVSSISLTKMIDICKSWIDADIIKLINKLIINPMYIISLGIQGEDADKYTAIYFPESDFLVNRISYPSTFSSLNAPAGHHSIQAEITFAKDSKIGDMGDDQILDHVITGLTKRQLIKGKVIVKDIKRSKESYIVYNEGYEVIAEKIRQYFLDNGITLIGRFGYFEYVNVDMALDRVVNIISKKYDQNRKYLFNLALDKISKSNNYDNS